VIRIDESFAERADGVTATRAWREQSAPTAADRAMNRYADGDEAAFAEVFHALAPRIHAFLRRLTGADDVAADLTQETFLRMHRARGSFVRGHGVLPWAYAIARNCFVSLARTPTHKAARRSLDVSEHEASAGPETSAEETLAARQSAEIVAQALARMSELNREAFVLLRFEGLSVAEAAQILGASESAVKLRAFRAYEVLREALKDSGG
jgi:RNA polymerase sigma-70 factor (ECF subfamily)